MKSDSDDGIDEAAWDHAMVAAPRRRRRKTSITAVMPTPTDAEIAAEAHARLATSKGT